MPLIINGGQVPPRWAERKAARPKGSGDVHAGAAPYVRIAFVNNMPDPALEDTEIQFFELLEAAAGDIPVFLKLYSLTGVPRGERGEQHLRNFYLGTDDLLNSQVDALIMTGTEPKQPDLRREPYWPALGSVLDWAEGNTVSAILSCLAAHAGVLHSDGIKRYPLPDKQFGVFGFTKSRNHQLNFGTGDELRFPHSRWNEVRGSDLTACGYLVLAQSAEGGVDSFIKKRKQSLFLYFQGHPEYGAQTLLKEYRRDIKRFLRRERETYPTMPKGYFDPASTKLLRAYQDLLVADRREELIDGFPQASLAGVQNSWHSTGVSIYRNWLKYVLARKADVRAFATMPRARQPFTSLNNEIA